MQRLQSLLLSLLLVFGSLYWQAFAVVPVFEHEADRLLYHQLSQEIRCLVCQNQSIADSDAPFAADLRRRLAAWVRSGNTREQIEARLLQHYGDKVLFKPVVDARTWLLWYGPYTLLLLGLVLVWRRSRV